MKVSILTSGFSGEFPESFVKCIKDYYYNDGSFVFVASDFENTYKSDKYSTAIISNFNNKDILFNDVYVIDSRTSKEDALNLIRNSAIVFLSGGDTLKQINSIKDYGLIPALQEREGITIGLSAGSINMAKKVVLAKNLEDNIPELSIYDGIGLVDINIEPHLDLSNENHLKEIHEASQHSSIYGLFDESFIAVIDEDIRIYGDHHIFKS